LVQFSNRCVFAVKVMQPLILATISFCFVAQSACVAHPVNDLTVAEVFSDQNARRLASAACDGDSEQVAELVANGTAVDAEGRFGVTPLIWTLTCRGLEFNDFIANRAALAGVPIVLSTVDSAHLSAIAALLEAGADPNKKIDGPFGPIYPGSTTPWLDGYSPVLIAAEFHETDVLRLLLGSGGDPQAVSGDGETSALMRAYDRGAWLDLGPQLSPDSALPWGNLHLLLGSGARLDQVVGNSLSVLDMASMHRPGLVLELLQTYPYEGGYEGIAYYQLNALEMGFPADEQRLALLDYLREARGVDLEAVREQYRMSSPDGPRMKDSGPTRMQGHVEPETSSSPR
jgi:ankyrin repeat protein